MKEKIRTLHDYMVKHESLLGIILLLICGLMLMYCILEVATNPASQWDDLKMYHAAARVFFEGGNYYDFELLKEKSSNLPYPYSPYAIYFLLFIGLLSSQKAALLWLGLKVGILIGLFWIWKKVFYDYLDEGKSWILFCLFLVWSLRALNKTIYLDLAAGNISIIEEFLIWSGMFFLLNKGRYLLFGLCLLITSFFKLLPIVLIGLVFVAGTGKMKDRMKQFGTICLVCFIVWGAGILIMPSEFKEWFDFLGRVSFLPQERGIINPAILPFLREITGDIANVYKLITYFLWVFLILFISYSVSKKLKKMDISYPKTTKHLFFLWCLAYPVIMPRFKDYTLIFLLPVLYYSLLEVIKNSDSQSLKFIAGFILLYSFFNQDRGDHAFIIHDYWLLFVAIASWIVFTVFIMKRSAKLESRKI